MPSTLTEIDAYIDKSAPFAQPILNHLRDVVHTAVPEVEEAVKWSSPFFVYKGIILAHMAAFKHHCAFGIWSEDVQGLAKEGKAKKDGGGGMGNFGKLETIKDLPAAKDLKKILSEAARKIDSGERVKSLVRKPVAKRATLEVPDALTAALKKNKTAALNFDAMSASCRREYCEWIAEAKRDETRNKRVVTALEWITEGKSRHWKYKNC